MSDRGEEIVELYNSGLSVQSVANKLNLSRGTIDYYLQYHGVPKRSRSESQVMRDHSSINGGVYMIIMAFDHGNTTTGWGVVDSQFGQPFKYIAHGLIEDPRIHYPVTLHKFTDLAGDLIDKYKPEMIALESPKDNKGFIATQRLTELVGCFKRLCISRLIPFSEIVPTSMKLMITGNGHATKEEVAAHVASMLGLKFEDIVTIEYYKQGMKKGQIKNYKLDSSDALALAIVLQPYIKRTGGMDYDPRKI